MKKILNHTIALIAAIILFAGCSEDFLKEEPPHIITTVTLYTSYNGFQSGLNHKNVAPTKGIHILFAYFISKYIILPIIATDLHG